VHFHFAIALAFFPFIGTIDEQFKIQNHAQGRGILKNGQKV